MVKKTTRSVMPQQAATERTVMLTATGVSTLVKIAASSLVAVAAAVAAYVYLGLPVVATHGYVEDIVRPIVDKVEGVNSSGLNGRIEQLAGNRQRALAEKFDLDLKTRTIKETAALQVIQGREREIDDIVKSLDEQIAATKAELLKSQETRTKK